MTAPEATDTAPAYDAGVKQKSSDKVSRIPVKVVHTGEALKKPDWIRVKASSPNSRFGEIKDILRANKLVTVCEEASCPNIGECFGKGTATFMIMGDKCTRRCPFCDVGHGRPDPLDVNEPMNLANTIAAVDIGTAPGPTVDTTIAGLELAANHAGCIVTHPLFLSSYINTGRLVLPAATTFADDKGFYLSAPARPQRTRRDAHVFREWLKEIAASEGILHA